MERVFGRIIQRITRDMTSGFREGDAEWRVERKDGIVVEGVRERRWTAQRGMVG